MIDRVKPRNKVNRFINGWERKRNEALISKTKSRRRKRVALELGNINDGNIDSEPQHERMQEDEVRFFFS